jgi:hypothetical protein
MKKKSRPNRVALLFHRSHIVWNSNRHPERSEAESKGESSIRSHELKRPPQRGGRFNSSLASQVLRTSGSWRAQEARADFQWQDAASGNPFECSIRSHLIDRSPRENGGFGIFRAYRQPSHWVAGTEVAQCLSVLATEA